MEIEANASLKSCPLLLSADSPAIACANSFGFFIRICAHGDLIDLVLKDRIPERAVKKILWPVIGAIEYLHSSGWAHRAIQPENIFLDGECDSGIPTIAYLGDLSFPQKFIDRGNPVKFTQPVGAPIYCAPVIWHGTPYDQSVDIWAFGVVLFVALTKMAPFSLDPDVNRELFLTYADEEEFEIAVLTRSGASKEAIALVRDCLKSVPAERMTAAQVKDHAFFREMC
jgi:serine/threonine protein kinase